MPCPVAFYPLIVVAYFLHLLPHALPLMKILPVIASYHSTQ
jgi:hypothetical protein